MVQCDPPEPPPAAPPPTRSAPSRNERSCSASRLQAVRWTGVMIGIGAIAPIPIITPVQRTACNRLAEQLRSFLEGADLVGGGAAGGGSGGSH